MTQKYIAITLFGLEEVLTKELIEIGCQDVRALNRAVSFVADLETMYKANLWSRVALKILLPKVTFTINKEKDFYREINKINWEEYMGVDDTFKIQAAVYSEMFTNSQYVIHRTKDAIVDFFKDKYDKRPSIEKENPSVIFNVHISQKQCSISLNTSGEALYKRSYRQDVGVAPINEILAAGIIKLSEWDKNCDLIDPMCGSGTFLIEAAMYALNIAPGINRKDYGFMNWSDFDKELWAKVLSDAENQKVEFNHNIIGYDVSPKAVHIAFKNAKEIGLEKVINFTAMPFRDAKPKNDKGIVVMNPPYGERIKIDKINVFYKNIGDKLKKDFSGYDAWLISNNITAIKHIGLRHSKKLTLFNGSLECKLLKYELYDGSKKAKYQVKDIEQ